MRPCAQSETAGVVVKFITENGSAVNPGQVRGRPQRCLTGRAGAAPAVKRCCRDGWQPLVPVQHLSNCAVASRRLHAHVLFRTH